MMEISTDDVKESLDRIRAAIDDIASKPRRDMIFDLIITLDDIVEMDFVAAAVAVAVAHSNSDLSTTFSSLNVSDTAMARATLTLAGIMVKDIYAGSEGGTH